MLMRGQFRTCLTKVPRAQRPPLFNWNLATHSAKRISFYLDARGSRHHLAKHISTYASTQQSSPSAYRSAAMTHLHPNLSQQNHYTVLDLPSPNHEARTVSQNEIKTAYRKALLRWHPDKARSSIDRVRPNGTSTANEDATGPSIDAITLAYKTLSANSLRADYDRALLLDRQRGTPSIPPRHSSKPQPRNAWQDPPVTEPHESFESVSLDDFTAPNPNGESYRACARCGTKKGFVVTEEELEEAATEIGVKEVLVPCQGCSLWVWVMFEVEAEDEGDNGGREDG